MYRKRGICIILTVAMVFCASVTAFAFEETATVRKADETAKSIEKISGNKNITPAFKKGQEQFYLQKNDTKFILPQNGEGSIILGASGMPKVSMRLPNQTKYQDGVLSKDGTVIYNSLLKDYSVAVQAVEKSFDGVNFNELRTSVVLNNKGVPTDYTFEYDLPKGYSMINLKGYLETYATDEEKEYLSKIENAIFILDQNGLIVYTIDGFEALDNKGNLITSRVEVNGNKITQSVELGENTNFPIVLHSTTHPDKKKTLYLDAKGIKAVRDRYAGSSLATIITGITGAGISAISNPAGYVFTFLTVAVSAYDQYSYTTWNTFYEKVSGSNTYKYLRTITTYHYHPGKRTYYPRGCDYAYAKKIPK